MDRGAAIALDPQIQEVLDGMTAAAAASGIAAHEIPIEQARQAHDRETEALSGPAEEVAEVREIAAGGVPVRLYRPDEGEASELPLVVYLHGGGWAIGSLESFDAVCRALANRSGAQVASVDYRLAPEHPYPAALDDSLAALDWLRDNQPHTRLAVAGDSAGGALAAIVARRRREDIAAQLLVYPVCDGGCATGSYTDFREGFGLTDLAMHRYWNLYANGADRGDPDLCPLAASGEELAGAPRAFVLLASHDVLRDEGVEYAEALQAAGVEVTLRSYAGTIHGFWRWLARCEVSRRAVAEAGAHLRAALA